MEKTVLISVPMHEFEAIVMDCVNACLKTRPENQPESDQILTIQQASELVKLTVPTLYGYVSRNEIPFSKRPNSKRLWFSKQDLMNWIKEGRKKTISEIKEEVSTYVKM